MYFLSFFLFNKRCIIILEISVDFVWLGIELVLEDNWIGYGGYLEVRGVGFVMYFVIYWFGFLEESKLWFLCLGILYCCKEISICVRFYVS